jgi:hypothetical protein
MAEHRADGVPELTHLREQGGASGVDSQRVDAQVANDHDIVQLGIEQHLVEACVEFRGADAMAAASAAMFKRLNDVLGSR